jgi:16S rRNA (uracil1498-N3)-methyltransferase
LLLPSPGEFTAKTRGRKESLGILFAASFALIAPSRSCVLHFQTRIDLAPGIPIIPLVARRIHVTRLNLGDTRLDDAQAHHARNVLRLTEGANVEVFDDIGTTAPGILMFDPAGRATVRVAGPLVVGEAGGSLTIVSAVPKGDRADWMVEKLSELGVTEWVPLAAARSVVLPEGKGKHDRWVRIATEAAKQSRRAGVMRIGELTKLAILLEGQPAGRTWCLATERDGESALELARATTGGLSPLTVFVGPEGGWSPEEVDLFAKCGVTFVHLTVTILRIETAAVALATVVGCASAAKP